MVSKWSYQGWLLSLEMTASKGSPDLRNSEHQRYFICVCTYVHTYTRLYFRACLTRKFVGFFQMQRQPSTEQQKSHVWSCVTELCLLLNPHLPAQSFGPEEWSLEAWAVQGVPQQAAGAAKQFHHGATTALLTAPLVPLHASSAVVPSSTLLRYVRGQELAGTAVGLLRDRTALSSCSSCLVEPGSIWGLTGQRYLLANV